MKSIKRAVTGFIGLTLLCACASTPPVTTINDSAIQLQKRLALAKTGAAQTDIAAYKQFIADNPLGLYADYNKELAQSLKEIQSSRVANLGPEALLGLPCYYHMQLAALVDAYRALARNYGALGQYRKAERSLIAALELAKAKSLSRYFMSVQMIGIYGDMSKICTASGKSGKALTAKFSADMLRDYLRSRQGITDFCLEQQLAVESRDQQSEVERMIDDVNAKRMWSDIEENMRMFDSFAQAAAATALNSPSAQGSDTVKMLRVVRSVAAASESASADGAGAGVFAALANPTIAGQLVDPRMSFDTRGVIYSFARAASALSGNRDIQEQAAELMHLADGLDELRAASSGKDSLAKMKRFASALDNFQNRVQQIESK